MYILTKRCKVLHKVIRIFVRIEKTRGERLGLRNSYEACFNLCFSKQMYRLKSVCMLYCSRSWLFTRFSSTLYMCKTYAKDCGGVRERERERERERGRVCICMLARERERERARGYNGSFRALCK